MVYGVLHHSGELISRVPNKSGNLSIVLPFPSAWKPVGFGGVVGVGRWQNPEEYYFIRRRRMMWQEVVTDGGAGNVSGGEYGVVWWRWKGIWRQ